jgi:sigma-B regulation protein RsbU (phosphoserine phosphatase)
MATTETDLRGQLLDWRQKLESSIAETRGDNLSRLLREVNLTLERMDTRCYGVCEVCDEMIGQEQLQTDPLARFCLSCLSPAQLESLQRDLERAWQIQGGLLPKRDLNTCNWEIGYHYEPVGPVGGDFCDLVMTESGDIFFLLGDVSGKGVAASMLMAHLHAIFRSLITLNLPARELVERANRIFCDFTMTSYFATLVCGQVERNGQLEICNAGHCPPLLLRGAQEITSIDATGLPVGMFCREQYTVETFQLSPGDTLFLYTDGLVEARNSRDEEYGSDSLHRLVSSRRASSAQGMLGACLEDLNQFQKGTAQTDDLTIMAIKRALPV